jgi:hypothetical protein
MLVCAGWEVGVFRQSSFLHVPWATGDGGNCGLAVPLFRPQGPHLFRSLFLPLNQKEQAWAALEGKYNYNRPGFVAGAGNFTQLVWRGTTRLGFACVSGPVNHGVGTCVVFEVGSVRCYV